MPAKTERQRRFFGAELGRARAGKKTRTGLPERKLREFAMKRKNRLVRVKSTTRVETISMNRMARR